MPDDAFDKALEQNIARVSESVVFCDLYSDKMSEFRNDPWPAIQLAIAILLDKPIILAVSPGRTPPAKLVKIADVVIEGGAQDIAAGISKFIAEHNL